MDKLRIGVISGTLNIHSRSQDTRARMLSPLFSRPFELDGHMFSSFEGFFNGIKFPEGDPRRKRAFASSYGYAQRFGDEAQNVWVWWGGKRIPFGSRTHIEIITQAHRASILQNDDLKQVLADTGNLELTHKIETREDPIYSEKMFCETLTKLRSELEASGFQANLDKGKGR